MKHAGPRIVVVTLSASKLNSMSCKRRPLVFPVAALLLCSGSLTACVGDGGRATGWEQDKESVIRSVQDLKLGQQQAREFSRAQVATSEARLLELESVNKLQQQEIDSLQAQLKALQLASKKAAVRKSVAVKKPVKKAKVEKKRRTTPVKAPVKPPVIPVKSKVDIAAEALAEKNAYTAAYLALKSGRFDEASSAFNAQLDQYPQGEYADQAWYWLGETRFAQGGLEKALHAFKYVADRYPDSAKHAAALLKLGQISEAMSHTDKAIAYYKRLVKEHSDSVATEQARSRIAELSSAGNR